MKWTNEMIKKIAMQQSAIDSNCRVEDFICGKNVVAISKENKSARKYLNLPHICNLISYGDNIVASVSEKYKDVVEYYINKYPIEHCFETPNMHVLNDAFQKEGSRVCFMAEYFLPDISVLTPLPCDHELKILYPEDFKGLYTETWSNALCEKRKELDILGVGAYRDGTLIGLAACSADCETMWQIGVDVLPEHRRKGIASALTSRLAIEILESGKVPFYCCAWSNLRSARNAIKSGFRPAWVEMTVKPASTVNEMNM
ncbi:GNAT family N-acetyltransferase [Lactobacillus iners]|uniref:GNAT family N-acetyltransferase n=2 Tax=Lactobacillus iners TaxID=147802 RepID=UPI0018E0917E|nr:GNAT family N-acetyltransferase [Lactobacillus iners]MDK7317020.1 GNAT family N-acetyltransferase [Lactobacillus iners]UHR02147.1 GNAT family N-acetyltransferase [Peptoniphilus sp. GNH]